MKERPITFGTEMVQALLRGGKTQTRRIVKPQPFPGLSVGQVILKSGDRTEPGSKSHLKECRYGIPGDRLWVREIWAPHDDQTLIDKNKEEIYFLADDEKKYDTDGKWRNQLYLPRWASRITLEIKFIYVNRVQEIREEDAKAEGVDPDRYGVNTRREAFKILWNNINGAGAWDRNDFVWVITFLIKKCRVCGCTDNDCRQCIAIKGRPCYWVEPDLCDACASDRHPGR